MCLRGRNVEDARSRSLLLRPPHLESDLFSDWVALGAGVGRAWAIVLAVESHIDSDGDGHVQGLRVVLGSAVVLVPRGVSHGCTVARLEVVLPC
jgi:hypothetical protein